MKFDVNAYTKQLKGLPKQAVKQTKFVADLSADKLLDSKKVVNKAEKATLTLNSIAYGTVEKLIGQQFNVVEGMVDASAKRLKAAVKANDAKTLVKAQTKLNYATRDRVIANAKATAAILVDARDNVVELFNNVYNVKPAAKKAKKAVKKNLKAKAKPAAKAVKKSAKKAAKKVNKKATKKASTTRAKAKTAAKRKTTRRKAA
ncbi:MAG: phasin family protein [Gammaproteobacteria bacterium]|nr:phasin family protein [Gammaproteobacteria bacterium]NNC98156.1 phasin family protein [Gammaproteobacteria bacterium]NNM13687.1 phasin family protein [Gammaproteobacteria bacterium]